MGPEGSGEIGTGSFVEAEQGERNTGMLLCMDVSFGVILLYIGELVDVPSHVSGGGQRQRIGVTNELLS